jgi:signal transduction histidine kinase
MNENNISILVSEHDARLAHVSASLLTICQAMGSSLELKEVLPTILRLSLQEMQAQQGSILLLDRVQDKLEMLSAIGLPQEIVDKGYIPRKGSIAEWVIENDQPLILNSRAKTEEYQGIEDRRKIHSSMCLPLRVRGAVIGTINMNRTVEDYGYFQDSDLDTMMILASQAAQCIENSRLHEANLKTERLAAIGQTVAGISHCIKNILTGVKGGMSLIDLAVGGEDWKLLGQGKDILHRNLDRLASIVLDMLDYSKEREPRKVENDAMTLLEEAALTVRSEAKLREIEMEFQAVEPGLKVQCDSQQIYRCVLNLVHNAIDATPKGGRVWLAAERTTDRAALKKLKDKTATAAVILRVGDTGPGIKDEHKTAIFDPFFSTKGSKGTGLGLAVTHKIIEEHGGHIEVESEPEQPAIFAIYLPD